MFMWNTRTSARTHTHTHRSHDFRTFDSYPCGFDLFFSVKHTNKLKHRHTPNNDVFCAGPRGPKRLPVRVSRDRWEELRNGGQIITHGGCTCCNHHNTTLLHPFPPQSCLTAPHHQIHCHRYVTEVFLHYNRSSWSFFSVVVCSFTVLTDRLVRTAAEVLGTHGDVWTTAGWWRGLAELQRVDDIIIFIYGLPCVAAASQINRMVKSHQTSRNLKCLKTFIFKLSPCSFVHNNDATNSYAL